MNLSLKILNNHDTLKDSIRSKLRTENRAKCSRLRDFSDLSSTECTFYAFDDEKLVGGLICSIEYNWIHVLQLYVEQEYRDNDIGTKLMTYMEEYAIKSGLYGIRLETWDFQAREFYEKLGYVVFAELHNYPYEVIEYQLKKILKEEKI